MMTEEKKLSHSEARAKTQLEGIVAMVKRLRHAQECKGGDGCPLTGAEINEAFDWRPDDPAHPTKKEREEYHAEDKAQEAIQEDPLSVQVRSGWQNLGEPLTAAEYEILLRTGRPAVRIIGDLDQYGQPDRARLQHQDGGAPWQEYSTHGEDNATILAYAQELFYGE